MRSASIAALVVVAAFMASCAPGANDELRALVDDANLPGVDSSACEWGQSTYERDPKSWYGCWGDVAGAVASVRASVESRLRAGGYRVTSEVGAGAVYLEAVRDGHTLCVDLLGPGYKAARNTSPAQVTVPPGRVFIDAWAVVARRPEQRCAALPADPDEA